MDSSIDNTLLDASRVVRATVDELNERAWELCDTDPPAALPRAQEALSIATAEGYRRGRARALLVSGRSRCLTLDCESALADLQEAARVLEQVRDASGKARALNWIANVHIRRADYPAALALSREALAIQRASGDREGEGYSLLVLGNGYFELAEYSRALEHYSASQRIREELGDRRGLAHCLNNIACIHGESGNTREALRFCERNLDLIRELGDRHSEATTLLNMGAGHELLGEYEKAIESFRCGLEVARAIGDRMVEANALGALGDAHRKKGDLERAVDCYRAGLEVARANGLRRYEAIIRIGLGQALAARGGEDALDHLRLGVEVAGEIGLRRMLYEGHRALSEFHEARGDTAGALEHFKAYHRIEHEIFNADSERRIQALLVHAEIERAERESELLRQKNEELDRLTREDALTGLSNRRHVDERLALEVDRARRFGRHLTVALLDLDHFKQINDRFSHAVGDDVLRAVGRILREGTRHVDVVGRYGGEELVLVLVETAPEEARGICERLRAAIEAHDWASIHPDLRVTASIGLSGDVSHETPEGLLAAADVRLYEAKRSGRNRVAG